MSASASEAKWDTRMHLLHYCVHKKRDDAVTKKSKQTNKQTNAVLIAIFKHAVYCVSYMTRMSSFLVQWCYKNPFNSTVYKTAWMDWWLKVRSIYFLFAFCNKQPIVVPSLLNRWYRTNLPLLLCVRIFTFLNVHFPFVCWTNLLQAFK